MPFATPYEPVRSMEPSEMDTLFRSQNQPAPPSINGLVQETGWEPLPPATLPLHYRERYAAYLFLQPDIPRHTPHGGNPMAKSCKIRDLLPLSRTGHRNYRLA